jgi:hypothetical protein
MDDLYSILFGEKGNFITKDGRVIFVDGPGSGGGTAGGGGGTQVTAANANELAQAMNDTELRDSLSRVKLEAGELTMERNAFQQAFDKLSSRSINEVQARNWVSTYRVTVRAGRELEDLGAHLNVVKGRIAELGPVYRALNDESVFRMRGGTR